MSSDRMSDKDNLSGIAGMLSNMTLYPADGGGILYETGKLNLGINAIIRYDGD